jgi:hypothetical protein
VLHLHYILLQEVTFWGDSFLRELIVLILIKDNLALRCEIKYCGFISTNNHFTNKKLSKVLRPIQKNTGGEKRVSVSIMSANVTLSSEAREKFKVCRRAPLGIGVVSLE